MANFEDITLLPVEEWFQEIPEGLALLNPVDGAPIGRPPAFLRQGELGDGLQAAADIYPQIENVGFFYPKSDTPTSGEDLGDVSASFEPLADRYEVLGYGIDGVNHEEEAARVAYLVDHDSPEELAAKLDALGNLKSAQSAYHQRLLLQAQNKNDPSRSSFCFGLEYDMWGDPRGQAERTILAIDKAIQEIRRERGDGIGDAAEITAQAMRGWYSMAQIGRHTAELRSGVREYFEEPDYQIGSVLLVPPLSAMDLPDKFAFIGVDESRIALHHAAEDGDQDFHTKLGEYGWAADRMKRGHLTNDDICEN